MSFGNSSTPAALTAGENEMKAAAASAAKLTLNNFTIDSSSTMQRLR
jgi:hypothetical protein